MTTSGRPVLSLSFAINHALGGYDPFGYHAANRTIHHLVSLAPFGIVRRTMCRAAGNATGERAFWVAASVSALWMLHPLQTSAVAHLSQRAESLCGLFYLLTVYVFVRGASSTRSVRWLGASIAACALGIGTREVMFAAPILMLLYDSTSFAGSFAGEWNYRRAIAARTGLGGALKNLYAFLLESCRVEEPLLDAEAAVKVNPRSAEAAFCLGNSLRASGRTQAAVRVFGKVVHLYPEHAEARNNLANLLVEMEQYEAALEHYLRVIGLRPETIPPRRNAAIILAMLGRNAGAIEQFEALARIGTEDPFYREQLERLRGRP